jgi:hypothetical protein
LTGGTKRFKQVEQEKARSREFETENRSTKESEQLQQKRPLELDEVIKKSRELYEKLKTLPHNDVLKSDLVSIFPTHHYLGKNNFNPGLNEAEIHPFVNYFYRFHRVCDVIEYPDIFLNSCDSKWWIADVEIPLHSTIYLWAHEWRTNKIIVDNIRPWNESEYKKLHYHSFYKIKHKYLKTLIIFFMFLTCFIVLNKFFLY